MTYTIAQQQQHVLNEVGSDSARRKWRRSGWPGMPISTLPLVLRDALNALIAQGKVQLVDRPSATRPGQTNTYIVAVDR